MVLIKRLPYQLLIIVFLFACNGNINRETVSRKAEANKARLLILKGNEVYSQKKGLHSFSDAMKYFDSATVIAEKLNDSLLNYESEFAKGRVYDAMNISNKTIQHYTNASTIIKNFPGKWRDYLYLKHLVAHAYEKANDSVNNQRILREIYDAIKTLPINVKKNTDLMFVSEMALSSIAVRNYYFADSILHDLIPYNDICNDRKTYNHKDNYLLASCMIDIYKNKKYNSPYLDSVEKIYTNCNTPIDSAFIALKLSELFYEARNSTKSYTYLKISGIIGNRISIESANQDATAKLLQLELQAEKRKAEFIKLNERHRNNTILLLLLGLVCTSGLLYYNYNLRKKLEIKSIQLDEKVNDISLLNKEIQHRIKNNLYMIYSLLHLQQHKIENQEGKDALQLAKLRIDNMSKLQDLFIEDYNIDFKLHIENIIESIFSCFDMDEKATYNISIEPIKLPIQKYLSISLLINEMITNSIKHAKTDKQPLEFNLYIKEKDELIELEYLDNGVVRSDELSKKGLGLQIIGLLVKQLKATLTYLNQNNFHYLINIKK